MTDKPRIKVTVISDEGVQEGVLTSDEHGDKIELGEPAPDYDPHLDYPERYKEGPI